MTTRSVFELQAELCKTMASAIRLGILHCLREGPRCVGDIARMTDLTQPTVSRHLAILRSHGVVTVQRENGEAVYHIADPKIGRVCDLMREVLADQMVEQVQLLQTLHDNRHDHPSTQAESQ
jgi:ArsR family transcriptional regulator, virulence genes transcriptional regulator